MSPGLFILTITTYLVCTVASLVGSFFAKHVPRIAINIMILIHVVTFIFWFLFRDEAETVTNPGNSNFLFLAFFCSGILISGILLRQIYPIYLKLYFSIFLCSLLIFIVSPSRVLGFIASGNIHAISSKRFHIKENYYFVEQQSVTGNQDDSEMPFKIVREMGFFHKTITRDVLLPVSTDSVLSIDFKENENIFVRIYFKHNSMSDSLDILVSLKQQKDSSSVITKKKPI